MGIVVKHVAIGAGGLGFDQIGHSVAKDSPTLQYFFGAVWPSVEMGPATIHASAQCREYIMKV